ncbi:Aste57867_3436 [Aphanomyces stellatus]|uniref:Aste57867_3436 protein n=1 Tax=Aphanomyces stellatus TaxID=120398 RepID=A0A485K9N7_9STRA|nr:hypothetical protein As57867_003426 [Aphanomyces stellatus]VFT80602.1 Aste57867_3436 [Aphanomyces stellatus]
MKLSFSRVALGPSLLGAALRAIESALTLFVTFLVIVDVISNNFEINHFIGNAKFFFTPLLDILTLDDLMATYTFANGNSPRRISQHGRWMVDYTLKTIQSRDGTHYFIRSGQFHILNAANDKCGTLVGAYVVPTSPPPGPDNPLRLAVANNLVTFVRGSTLGNTFGTPPTPAAKGTNSSTLIEMGYTPGRIDVDMRFTSPLPLPLDNNTNSTNVSMYRIFPKTFCSGCDPKIELGHVTCGISYALLDNGTTVRVKTSAAFIGDYHHLGTIIPRDAATSASLVVRGICVIFAIASYGVSKKTVRWTDPPTMSSLYKRIMHTFAPTPLYKFPSHTFSFATFCLDSDIFVFLYTLAVLLDEKDSILYTRSLNVWNQNADNMWVPIQLLAYQFRWLWLNCAILKLLKGAVNFASMTRYSGSNVVVGYLNFSDVSFVYLGAAVLMLRTSFIEYGNTDNLGVLSTAQNLDSIRLDWYESWYVRAMPQFVLVMFVNLFIVLSIDRLLNFKKWQRIARNSLGRQAMFNSTSILTVTYYKFHDLPGYDRQAVMVQARALCTAQWFLMCHTTCFGLPEHPKNVRAMISKSLATAVNGAPATSNQTSTSKQSMAYDPMHKSNVSKHQTIQPKNEASLGPVSEDDEAIAKKAAEATAAASPAHEMYIVAQDPDCHIHLYDAKKREIQAMSLEVKILGDTCYIIA